MYCAFDMQGSAVLPASYETMWLHATSLSVPLKRSSAKVRRLCCTDFAS